MRIPRTLNNETHQSRDHVPTSYENLLGDSIERAFTQGIHELSELVAYLNSNGPAAPNGQKWSDKIFQEEISRLGS